jgi:integrase
MAAKMEKTATPGVYKRGGRYVISYRDAEGKQRWESVRTYKEARSLKARRAHQADTGELHREVRLPFATYAREWVHRYQGRGRRGFRETTREDYERDLERYAIPYFDERLRRTVGQITPRDVANWIAWLCDARAQQERHEDERRDWERADESTRGPAPVQPAEDGLSDASVRRILTPLRSCLASALQEGIIRSNPCSGVALPVRDQQRAIDAGIDEDDDHEVKALTREQLAMFLRVVNPKWRPFFQLLAVTGLRISEALALRWSDLALDGSSPHVKVRRAYVRGRFAPPKSKYGRRDVPLPHDLVSSLRARRNHQAPKSDRDLVFPSRAGTPMGAENLRRRVLAPAAEEAGASWAGYHAFRHTCASMLFAEGRNAVQVQRWLGHHSPAFTLSVYVHLLDDNLGEPLDLSRALNSANEVQTSAASAPVDLVGESGLPTG